MLLLIFIRHGFKLCQLTAGELFTGKKEHPHFIFHCMHLQEYFTPASLHLPRCRILLLIQPHTVLLPPAQKACGRAQQHQLFLYRISHRCLWRGKVKSILHFTILQNACCALTAVHRGTVMNPNFASIYPISIYSSYEETQQ